MSCKKVSSNSSSEDLGLESPVSNSKVLVVDDEKSIRLTMKAFLEAEGYQVEAAESAKVALKLLKDGDFDVVVSDIVLPEISGVELLRRIHEDSPRVRVIMMTGEPTVQTASEAVRMGAQDYLCKPVTKAELLLTVRNAAEFKWVDDERRRLDEANRNYRDNLEKLVDERTRQLKFANKKLRRTLKNLKELQDKMIQRERLSALGQMASGIVHDFNNALSIILGHGKFFLHHPEAYANHEDVKLAMNHIVTGAEDAKNIVHQLREFYRPGDNSEFVPINLKDVISKAVQLTKPKWREESAVRGCQIKLKVELERLPMVRGSESQLREAIINLIMNSVDAIMNIGAQGTSDDKHADFAPSDQKRSGLISIRSCPEQDKVVIQFSDNGPGMAENVRRHCFEPFYTTKGEQGTGLGLSMVHGIIQRHQGVIEVSDAPGGGTMFSIRLPRYGNGQSSTVSKEEMIDFEPGPSRRILVIDDNESLRITVRRVLERYGHVVEVVESSEEGIVLVKKALAVVEDGELGSQPLGYDVVITDRALENQNGDEVARAVKTLNPRVGVIMLTGFADMMRVNEEMPEYVDRLMDKPFDEEDLLRTIRQLTVAEASDKNGENS